MKIDAQGIVTPENEDEKKFLELHAATINHYIITCGKWKKSYRFIINAIREMYARHNMFDDSLFVIDS